jgi:hypothetical protein
MLNLRKLFRLQSKKNKSNEQMEVLYIREDDYLMIELVPKENFEFIINETKRIKEFGKEHSVGIGFTDITIIGDKPVKTIDKRIPVKKVGDIFIDSGLRRIQKVFMQDVGLLEDDKAPVGFGTDSFAVILESKTDILEDIWITGKTENENDRLNLKNGLLKFGRQFDFMGVDWFKSKFYDLSDEKQVEEYIINSC